ncbi:MAG: MBL fold metallo-hydrolase [Chloroflexi bacterium]|nr:MAG: MBL fold metallo-hydrolase [Chloroflexota bacterium]
MTREVVWDRGVSLPGHRLWLDPLVVRSFAFISHAHTDHARRHKEALLTPQTLALIPEARRPRGWRMLGFGETMRRGEGRVTLYPAGHMLGSAQLLCEHEGHRLLYTGDLKLRHGASRADTPIPGADVVVIESTYGQPHFRFPDADTVTEAVALWCRRALDANATPVLLANAMGKAQEVMLALAPHGFRFALEERCVPFARGYEAAGVTLPDWIPLDGNPGDRVVVVPPVGKDAIRALPRYRTALISGWAQDAGFWRVFGADLAFPLSDHCDFDELLEVIRRSGANKVYTVHGFPEDFARHLRKRGVRAHALHATEQLALAL